MSAPPQPVTAQAGPPAGAPSQAAARALLGRFQENVKHSLAHQRPWHELIDRNSFQKFDSLNEATSRIKKNASYFRVNYAIILVGMVSASMLMKPMSIIWLAVLAAAWLYVFMIRADPIQIYGRYISEREKFFLLLALTVVVVFLTNVGAILMSGIIFGAVAVCVHGAFRVPDDLFLDDQDAGGFLSFLGPSQGSKLPTSIGHV